MQVKYTRELILRWLCDNEYATDFYNTLWTIGQTWDDLIDRDKVVAEDAINNAFILALVDIKNNAFYASYQKELDPLIILAINDWLDSVHWEKEKNEKGLELGYSLRQSMLNVLIYSALLLGGWAHMRQVSAEVRQMLLNNESLKEYKAGFHG